MGKENDTSKPDFKLTHQIAQEALQMDEDGVEFADDLAREAWEIRQEINRISTEIPPETCELKAQLIKFDSEYKRRGLRTIFTAGTVIPTGHKDILFVPQRTLDILEKLNIPFMIVSNTDLPQNH